MIELMISIALVLFLILGVNQVFEYTTRAVGAGEAINSAIRLSRAGQATFSADMSAMVPPGLGQNDSGALIIRATARYAYANAKDMASEGQYPPTLPFGVAVNAGGVTPGAPYQDFAGTGNYGDPNVPGDITFPFQYNNRNHRLDVLSFFARDLFHRQTGNPGVFVDDMSSAEAWIWYGHLWLPDNSGAYVQPSGSPPSSFPCEGTKASNPNNFFGNQLVLGRMAMLLVPKTTTAQNPNGFILDQLGYQQWFNDRSSGNTNLPDALEPLAASGKLITSAGGSTPTDPGPQDAIFPRNIALQSRVDLANTSIRDFQQRLLSYINNYGDSLWYSVLLDGENAGRYQCNPFVSKPMQSVDMAHASPYFLGGCSQFIVEFAGDYVSQVNDPTSANYGQAISSGPSAAVPDNVIDYKLVTDPVTFQIRKQIIWYGLPRNTSGQPGCNAINGDVAPLLYWLTAPTTAGGFGITFTTANPYPYSFERSFPTLDNATDLRSMRANSQYVCAWGPKDIKPSLIRITLTLDDPTGRLPNGQTYQYVFAVP